MSISRERIGDVVTNYIQNLNDLDFEDVKQAFANNLTCEELNQLDKSDINEFIKMFVDYTDRELREMLSGTIGYYQNEFKEEAGCSEHNEEMNNSEFEF